MGKCQLLIFAENPYVQAVNVIVSIYFTRNKMYENQRVKVAADFSESLTRNSEKAFRWLVFNVSRFLSSDGDIIFKGCLI